MTMANKPSPMALRAVDALIRLVAASVKERLGVSIGAVDPVKRDHFAAIIHLAYMGTVVSEQPCPACESVPLRKHYADEWTQFHLAYWSRLTPDRRAELLAGSAKRPQEDGGESHE